MRVCAKAMLNGPDVDDCIEYHQLWFTFVLACCQTVNDCECLLLIFGSGNKAIALAGFRAKVWKKKGQIGVILNALSVETVDLEQKLAEKLLITADYQHAAKWEKLSFTDYFM